MRSSSVPKFSHTNVQSVQNNENHQNEPRANSRLGHQRNVSFKELPGGVTAANAGKEVLRNNGSYVPGIMTSQTIDPPIGYGNLYSPSQVPMKTSNNWKDYITNQSQASNLVVQSEKFENKIRAMKYKEVLDKMMKDEKQRKLQTEKEFREGIPINHEAIKVIPFFGVSGLQS